MEYRAFGNTGFKVSCIGMGTYYGVLSRVLSMAPGRQAADNDKIRALRKGIELGLNFIDTAEVYQTEGLVSEALSSTRRDDIFLATKIWPSHLHYDHVLKCADASLSRLKADYIDLYQIHWPNDRIPIRETMRAMEELVNRGKVRYIGVSNFSVRQMKEAREALSKHELVSNQVEYSLISREVETDLLPYCKASGVALIAYRPVAHGALAKPDGALGDVIDEVSKRHGGRSPSQIALNWLLSRGDNVFPIPRASRVEHVVEDAGAVGWRLEGFEIDELVGSLGRPA